jgi:hypothetical protein
MTEWRLADGQLDHYVEHSDHSLASVNRHSAVIRMASDYRLDAMQMFLYGPICRQTGTIPRLNAV